VKIFLSLLLFINILYGDKILKIASYNVENLFDLQNNGNEYKEYIPNTIANWNNKIYKIKLQNISKVIVDIDADIIALQEIENINVFNLLQKRLKKVGCEYKYSSIANKQNSSVKVALLSKYKITESSEIKIDNSKQKRSILEAHLNIKNNSLIIFVNHWKSKYNLGKESKRIKSAKALINRIKNLPKDKEYLLLGDFNSNYDEYLTIKNKFNDTNSITGINHILKTIDNNILVNRDLISKKYNTFHYNLWLEVAKNNRFSRRYFSYKGSVDSIILPYNMFNNSAIEYIYNSFNIFKPRYLFTKKGAINRWQFKKNRHIGKGYSDHLPIYASFKIYEKTVKNSIKIDSIDDLYKIDNLRKSITLKNIKVIFKRGKNAIIKQNINARGIYLYNIASNLKEGKSYNIQVDRIDNYNGLKEITKISNMIELQDINSSKYIKNHTQFNINTIKQNDIFRNLIGVYKKGFFYINSQKIPIYFRDKRVKPKDGSKLKLLYTQIGYYNTNQLLIYSKDDFEIF
jgi:endonuclease/exonuclease/phosphatase family metal-dependent hydrolase